jgi:hypothetical protein
LRFSNGKEFLLLWSLLNWHHEEDYGAGLGLQLGWLGPDLLGDAGLHAKVARPCAREKIGEAD